MWYPLGSDKLTFKEFVLLSLRSKKNIFVEQLLYVWNKRQITLINLEVAISILITYKVSSADSTPY